MNLENTRHGEDRTVALRYTRIHENAIHAIGTKLSYSAMKVYLYINFNCNLASGITHRLSYSRIAEYWGITLRSVYREVAEYWGITLRSVYREVAEHGGGRVTLWGLSRTKA